MNKLILIPAIVFGVLSGLGPASAQSPDNPRPAEGDFVLPMPGNGEMVFRKVLVPGSNFWGDEARIVQIGDAEGGIFEGLQRVQISGSFKDPGGNGWYFLLGKYEVTKKQVSAVLGLDEYVAASGWSDDNRLTQLAGEELDEALSHPATALHWVTVQQFVDQYNRWLFDPAHPERLSALPKLNDVPGYLRLPTELEWEYAARGGQPAAAAGSFSEKLPFPAKDLRRHAWYRENAKHKLRPVGLRNASSLGFHDLFGNAQELTIGPFLPEIWQGKPGALAARGGSVSTPAAHMRSSYRTEVERYRWNIDNQRMEPQHSPTTGFRLAVGSNVLVRYDMKQELENEYAAYRQGIRSAMPVGKTLDNPVAQAATNLGDIHQVINELIAGNPSLEPRLLTIQSSIYDAEEQLDRGLREAARASTQDALRYATNLGRDIFKIETLRTDAAEKAEKLADMSTRYQKLLDTIKDQIEKRQGTADDLFERYLEQVARIGDYGSSYVEPALKHLGARNLTQRARAALALMSKHIDEYEQARRADRVAWRKQFDERFKDIAD